MLHLFHSLCLNFTTETEVYGFLCEHWLKPANFQKNLLISRLLNLWRDKKNTEGTSLFGSTTTNNPSVIIDKKCHHLLTPIYQKNETHCKMNMLKLTYQTYLEAGKSQQLLPPPTPSFTNVVHPTPTILHCHCLFFLPWFLLNMSLSLFNS